MKCLQTYTIQETQTSGSKTMTLFHKMLHFLTLKYELAKDEQSHPPKEQVKDAIFDQDFLKYMEQK